MGRQYDRSISTMRRATRLKGLHEPRHIPEGSHGHCQVASSGRVMVKPAALQSGCRRNFGNLVPRAERGIASRAILVGIEVMTTELEMVVDPTVGGEETLRMTR